MCVTHRQTALYTTTRRESQHKPNMEQERKWYDNHQFTSLQTSLQTSGVSGEKDQSLEDSTGDVSLLMSECSNAAQNRVPTFPSAHVASCCDRVRGKVPLACKMTLQTLCLQDYHKLILLTLWSRRQHERNPTLGLIKSTITSLLLFMTQSPSYGHPLRSSSCFLSPCLHPMNGHWPNFTDKSTNLYTVHALTVHSFH